MAILSTDSIPLQQAIRRRPTPKAVGGPATARAHGWSTDGSGAGTGPLGNNAKFPALGLQAVDQDTGEIFRIERKPDGSMGLAAPSAMERRALMYARKAIVDDHLQLLPARKDGQPHRTFKCYRVPLPASQVAAMYSHQYSKAFYAGLQVCANPWLCPVCMRKLSERKKVEVETGVEIAKAMGRRAVLMTLTFKHSGQDKLDDLLKCLLDAYERGFSKNKSARLFKEAMGTMGNIKALEITWGEKNGFHPHLHVLMLIDKDAPSPEQIQIQASAIWRKACMAVGRIADPVYGCNVQEGDSAGGYLSKMGLDDKRWTLASEMTKGSSKNGKATGLSMMQLVDLMGEGHKAATAAWVQMAIATQGRHPLRWSNGLRKALGMAGPRTDEELAAETEDETAEIFSRITSKGWKLIYARKLRAHLLDLIETNPDGARAFISSIEKEASCSTTSTSNTGLPTAPRATSTVSGRSKKSGSPIAIFSKESCDTSTTADPQPSKECAPSSLAERPTRTAQSSSITTGSHPPLSETAGVKSSIDSPAPRTMATRGMSASPCHWEQGSGEKCSVICAPSAAP